MDSHNSNNTAESEKSIELSTKKKKKWHPETKLIFVSGFAEDKVTTNCSHLRSETFYPSPYFAVSEGQNITIYIEFIDLSK